MPRKHVRDLLAASPAAAQALALQERDRALLTLVRRRLPADAREHCISAGQTRDRLVLTFDSPAWATRTRFEARDIAESLGLCEAAVRARPAPPPRRRRQSRRPRVEPTAKVIANLLATAEVVRDPGLGDALKRLARHLCDGQSQD